MEIGLEQLKVPTATQFPPADEHGFLEAMYNNQAVAAKVAYIVEETFEPMMCEAEVAYTHRAVVREWRNRNSREPMISGNKEQSPSRCTGCTGIST